MIIRGNLAGALLARPDWNEENEESADFIRGKETVTQALAEAAGHAANKNNPHGVTRSQLGAAAENHSHTPASLGAVTEAQVRAILQEQLGVIENGAY